jgi:ferrous iron transport protein A
MVKRTVADLKMGETAVIKAVFDQTISLKLLEMGCLPGRTVRVQAAAPFGGPLCIHIEGSHQLALRLSEAASIEID